MIFLGGKLKEVLLKSPSSEKMRTLAFKTIEVTVTIYKTPRRKAWSVKMTVSVGAPTETTTP